MHPIDCQTFWPISKTTTNLGVSPQGRADPTNRMTPTYLITLNIPRASTRGGSGVNPFLVSEACLSRWLSSSTHAMPLQLQQLVTEHNNHSRPQSRSPPTAITPAQPSPALKKASTVVVGNLYIRRLMSIASCQIHVRDYYDLTERPRPLEPVTERKEDQLQRRSVKKKMQQQQQQDSST